MENNTINFNDSKNNIHKTYKTKEVAEILNVNTQTIRNYCLTFSQFLDVGKDHKPGRHRNFTKQDIKKLKLVKYLIDEKHFDTDQVFLYFKNFHKNEEFDDFNFLIQIISDIIISRMEEILDKYFKSNTHDITDIKNILKYNSNTINQIHIQQTQYVSRVQRRKNKRKQWFKFFKK